MPSLPVIIATTTQPSSTAGLRTPYDWLSRDAIDVMQPTNVPISAAKADM